MWRRRRGYRSLLTMNGQSVPPDNSVTCLLCGRLADERKTVRITQDETEIDSALSVDNPCRAAAIEEAAQLLGEGEAHPDCLEKYETTMDDRHQMITALSAIEQLAGVALEDPDVDESATEVLEQIIDHAVEAHPNDQ